MIKIKNLKIIVGLILLISSITVFAMLFFEPEALAVLINFSIDITASNLGEAIAGLAASIAAGFVFLIGMLILGGIYFIFYLIIAGLTISHKRSKTITIIVIIISGFSLFLEIRALIILTIGGYASAILTLHLIGDVLIVGLSIYSVIKLFQPSSEVL